MTAVAPAQANPSPALPASNTQTIKDHHTGYFFTSPEVAGNELSLMQTPNLDAAVGPDGTWARA